MNIIVPQSQQGFTVGVLRWAQSVYKALNAGLSFGKPTGQNASKVYNAFIQDNLDGILLRIGPGETLAWPGTSFGIIINHGLHRQPIGFIVVDNDRPCNIYRVIAPTKDDIVLATSDSTASVLVYIY